MHPDIQAFNQSLAEGDGQIQTCVEVLHFG